MLRISATFQLRSQVWPSPSSLEMSSSKTKKRRSRHRLDNVCTSVHKPSRQADVTNLLPFQENNRASDNAFAQAPGAISPALRATRTLEEDPSIFDCADALLHDFAGEGDAQFADEPAGFDNTADNALAIPLDVHCADVNDPEEVDLTESTVLAPDGHCLAISDWQVLWGLVVTNGSLKITKAQYQSMRLIADTFRRVSDPCPKAHEAEDSQFSLSRGRISALTHYNTLFKKFKPLLYKRLTVRGRDTFEKLSMRKAGARATQYSTNGEPLTQVHTILPSEYAIEDIACDPVFKLMKEHSLSGMSAHGDCVDKWPIVASRAWFYGPRRYISVNDCSRVARHQPFAEAGDVISIHVIGYPQLKPEVLRAVSVGQSGETSEGILTGSIVHIWTVHHEKRPTDNLFDSEIPTDVEPRNRNLIMNLQFSSYLSPSDTVDVPIPELPVEDNVEDSCHFEDDLEANPSRTKKKPSLEMADSLRKRKEALKERRKQMEQAWMGWQKPVVKPGDIVALVRPEKSQFEISEWSRVCVVLRFWTEHEERNRHVLWVSSSSHTRAMVDQQDQSTLFSHLGANERDLCRDVRSIKLISSPSRSRGYERTEPISSHGHLGSGEPYFIYRFILFWDGFEITRGKSASGEGFYMVCLDLPPAARASPNAVRILSLTPPGVKSDVIFKNIQEDIITGMTHGFWDLDSEGNRIKIFLDLVGFIGDTPAINAVLDVLGYTCSACCHLCRYFRRSSTIVGSRYTRHGSYGLCTSTGRIFYQHTAVRDSDAKPDTCRLLGMSPTDIEKHLPIHELRYAMLQCRPQIPTLRDGVPILTGHLDPCISCWIGPDHLLTGHFRDCVNAAYRLLPSKEYRKSVEAFSIGLLADCNLPTQNRIFDIDKKSLFSMSMTELYALSVIAQLGFLRGCAAVSPEPLHLTLSPRCLDAISIVGSCSSLIAQLWHPHSGMQCTPTHALYISHIQCFKLSHMRQVVRLCTMDDSDVLAMQSNRGDRARRAMLVREHRDCITVIKCIDKPNIHRLLELVHTTIPMIGLVSRIGELVLKKSHQALKRAIQHSNNKEVHVQSVLSSVFNDWQGRLTVQASGAMAGCENAARGCFRLLAGRESVVSVITPRLLQLVRNALGPDCCVPALLDSQAKSVLSPRGSCFGPVSWSLETNIEHAAEESTLSTRERSVAYFAFSRLCSLLHNFQSVTFGQTMRSRYENGLTNFIIRCGDILAVQCHALKPPSAHFPKVAQCYFKQLPHVISQDVEILFWGVIALFTRQRGEESKEYWVAVNPCRELPIDLVRDGNISNRTRYTLEKRVSFLEVEPTLRVVARIPICNTSSCAPSQTKCCIAHSTACNPFEGTPFYILSKSEGYPPRQG